MTTSVALCTYNGEKYIEEQLLSILNQSKPVDQIVVSDDNSTDNTINIVERIASKYTDFQWKIVCNKEKLGVCNNFAQALSLTNGDIIFLSDQDDIWFPIKVETIYNFFTNAPNTNVIFSNATIIGVDTKLSLFDTVGFTPKLQKQFDEGWAIEFFTYEAHATGATMALRSSILNGWNVSSKRNNIYNSPLHDVQLIFKALETDSLGYITTPLTQYRIHTGNICGLGTWLNNPPNYGNLWEPKIATLLTEDGLSHKLLRRMRFYKERAIAKEYKFGRYIIFKLYSYIKIYGHLWYKAYWSDIKYSISITTKHYLQKQ